VDHLLAPVNAFAERPQRPAHDDVQAASFVSGDEENFVARQAAFDRAFGQRENGAKIIVVDPRITPVARTCDLFLPIKPGRDVALFNGVLHLMIENDWLDHDFIDNHTVGFDAVAEHVREWTPRRTAEVTGITERAIRQAAEM
jgi:anaerobic selenocysteine-containing dehydrogenase